MTDRIEVDGVVYHVETGHVYEANSAFVWKEKFDKKSEKNFYVNLSTNEKKWSLPKSATKKKSTLGSSSADMGAAASPATGGGPLTVPGFGSLLAFQPAEPPATAAPLDAAAKKKSSVVKKKKKEDGSDGAGLTKTKSSKKSSGAASSGEGLDVPTNKGDEGGSDDDDNDNMSAASPPPVPPTFSSFPSILVEEASDALSFPGSPSTASKATKSTKTKAASSKTLKKSKSDVTGGDGGLDDVVGAENTEVRPKLTGDDTATGADAAASPLKKKKSSTVKKGTTKKSKKTTNDADATAASDATGGTETNNDDDGDEEEDGGDEGQAHEPIVVTQHLAPPGPSAATNPPSPSSSRGGEENHAFDDIPLYSSVMIPNTPTTELPNAASFFNAAQPPRGGADRTPRQVSFVGDAREFEGNVPLPQSRVGSLWGDELTSSSSRGVSRGDAEEAELRVASADTNYPSVDEEHAPQLGGDDMASWKSLQESFSSMMTGINGGNSAAAVSSQFPSSTSAEVSPVVDSLSSPSSAYRLPGGARIPDLASSSQSQRLMVGRNATQQLQGDWAAIMEPIDRPHGRLEQPEGRVHAAHPDSLRSRTREYQSLPPAALSQADMLHDDETPSPARVARVAQSFRSPALTAVEIPVVNASATAMTTARVTTSPSRWDQQQHGGNRGDDESNADPFYDEWTAQATMTTNNVTTTTITSPQPLVDDDLLPATIVRRPQQAPVVTAAVNAPPQTEGDVTQQQQQQGQNGRSRTTSPRQQLHLSPPAVTIRNDRRSAATDASAQELLLRSLDDEDDATFFRGDDFVTQPPRVPAASSVTRPSGISSTRGKSPVVGTRRHAAAVTPPPQTIRRAAPTGGVAAFQGGGGGGGGGGAVSSRAVTPNRQIATGPRYIQATARYPSSFAPQRTRSPEPVATATSSRTPTPSIALPRHSRSPHISPQPSRSPSIPIPSHSSYPYSSSYQTHHHHTSSPHYNYNHDNIPLYHRSSQYEPLAVIDSQHVRVASKNGGKAPAASHHHNSSNNIASTSRPNRASAHDESYNSAADPPAQNTSQPLPQQHPQPIIIYTSPPPPNMAGPLGWWGPPLQGNIPYTGPQQGASPMPTMPAMNEHSPPPSVKAAAPVFVNDVSSSEQRPQRPQSHRVGGGRKIFPSTTSSGEQGTSTSYLHTLAAMRVGERYKDASPSSTDFGSVTAASRPPHIPSTLLGYLKPAELQQLEQLQQGWHAARDRAARLRLGIQNSYQTLTPSTKSSLEALRSRQEALLASQTRTHEVTWQHHLATLGGQQ